MSGLSGIFTFRLQELFQSLFRTDDNYIFFWLIALVAFLIIEIITLGLTTIWFAAGSLISFIVALAFSLMSDTFSPVLYVLFLLVGFGWAGINVNSLPMVLEMCKGSDIGKFTGYYYTFSIHSFFYLIETLFKLFINTNIP